MTTGYQQTTLDLEDQLRDQIQFIICSADSFDRGFEAEAKRLAHALRVLLHETVRSRSLLGQLGTLDRLFLDTASPVHEDNLLTTHALAAIRMGQGEPRYVPALDSRPSTQMKSFADWWAATIIVDDNQNKLSRSDIVLAVAHKDGGSHVDPILSEQYAALSRGNSLGWQYEGPNGSIALRSAEGAAVRQIAHEVLRTLLPTYAKAIEEGSTAPLEEAGTIPHKRPEISDGKMRFFPEVGQWFFQNDPAQPPHENAKYVVEAVIDTMSVGSVHLVVGGVVSKPFIRHGHHYDILRAGSQTEVGVLGCFTDAVIDRVSVRELPREREDEASAI